MNLITLTDVAGSLVRAASMIDRCVVVIAVQPTTMSVRWNESFPSLPANVRNALHEDRTAFLDFANRAEARATFERLIEDCVATDARRRFDGVISLVQTEPRSDDEIETVSWGLHNDERPVMGPDGTWRFVGFTAAG